jgi:hypothetical protein
VRRNRPDCTIDGSRKIKNTALRNSTVQTDIPSEVDS